MTPTEKASAIGVEHGTREAGIFLSRYPRPNINPIALYEMTTERDAGAYQSTYIDIIESLVNAYNSAYRAAVIDAVGRKGRKAMTWTMGWPCGCTETRRDGPQGIETVSRTTCSECESTRR